ncbi:MAG: glycosyltransferase [Mycoplasmoidaceae bacterium]
MKNILIITPSLFPNIGGVEKYVDNLIKYFSSKNYQIDLYINRYQSEENKKQHQLSYPHVSFFYKQDGNWIERKMVGIFKFHAPIVSVIEQLFDRKNFDNKINISKYSIIIDNSVANYKILRNQKKAINVLHADPHSFIVNKNLNFKGLKDFILKLLKIIFVKFTRVLWSYKDYKNLVMFSSYDADIFKKHWDFNAKKQKIFYCLCAIKDYHTDSHYNPSGNIISILRYENQQKNLKFMDQVSQNLNSPISVYGEGPDKKLFKNTIIFDAIKDELLKIKILTNAAVFIMTSNYEGLPFSIIEALSIGLPIVIRDTFPNAKLLVKENYNGLIFNHKSTPIEVANKITKLLKNKKLLKEMNNNSYKIYLENFTIDKFYDSWDKIIKVLNK